MGGPRAARSGTSLIGIALLVPRSVNVNNPERARRRPPRLSFSSDMSKLMLRYIRPCPSYISDSMPVSASEVAKALDKNEYITWIPPV